MAKQANLTGSLLLLWERLGTTFYCMNVSKAKLLPPETKTIDKHVYNYTVYFSGM